MTKFSSLGIFWMAFASFIGPVFLIALVCSIIKAVRSRKAIQMRQRENKFFEEGTPVDAEIITSPSGRRKPKIEIIEDEAMRKQFRNSRGSLTLPDRPFAKHKSLKDTPVDKNSNKGRVYSKNKHEFNNIIGGNVDVHAPNNIHANDRGSKTRITSPPKHASNHFGNSNGVMNNNNVNNNYYNSVNGIVGSDKDIHKTSSNGRRRSLGHVNVSSPETSHLSNGHITRNADGLKPPYYYTNRSRRHSVQSSSPTLERIPEGRATEVEMNTFRSKSEDNLVEHNPTIPSNHMTDQQGRENEGFAQSMETTIM